MIAWTIYITFAGAVVIAASAAHCSPVGSRWSQRSAGFAVSLATFFRPDVDLAHFTTIVRVPWVPALGMNYHLAARRHQPDVLVLVTGI